MLEFEWDREKARRNEIKHGISFEEAKAVFYDIDRVVTIDDRIDYGEERFVAIGSTGKNILTIVYVLRAEVIRVISARRASREERDEYSENRHVN